MRGFLDGKEKPDGEEVAGVESLVVLRFLLAVPSNPVGAFPLVEGFLAVEGGSLEVEVDATGIEIEVEGVGPEQKSR